VKNAIAKKFQIENCTKCGNECAESCLVYRCYGTGHPQQLSKLVLESGADAAAGHRLLWECVTCGACRTACPYDVPFDDFIRELRAGRSGSKPAFEGLVQIYQRMQADLPSKGQDRLFWLNDSLEINGSKDTALFTGCIPFFEKAFSEACGTNPVTMLRSAVRLLNRLGVSPVIFEDERCCGKDMYDLGERVTFEKLARHNLALLKKRRIKTLITVCPECAWAFQSLYEKEAEKPECSVVHITSYLAANLEGLEFAEGVERFAFQDPCYLARYLGVTDEPREILEALSAEPLAELERRGEGCGCCGMGSWINHGPHTRQAAGEITVDAHRKGAETLVTACPKCSILFREVNPDCSWKVSPVAVTDLLTLAATRLREE
jgi:Fe-S oxidoreductase